MNDTALSEMTEVVKCIMLFMHNYYFNIPRTDQAITLGLRTLKERDTRQKPELLTWLSLKKGKSKSLCKAYTVFRSHLFKSETKETTQTCSFQCKKALILMGSLLC